MKNLAVMRCIAGLLLGSGWLLHGTAHAQEVSISMRGGGEVSGKLVEYTHGKHAVVSLDGESHTMRIAAAAIESLIVAGARPSSCRLQAIARLKGGATISGALIDYALYSHVSISLGDGEPTRLESKQLKAVELLGGFGPRCESAAASKAEPAPARTPTPQSVEKVRSSEPRRMQPTAADVQPKSAPMLPMSASTQPSESVASAYMQSLDPAARAAAIQALMSERADWQARYTGLTAPLLFTVAGAVIAAAGGGIVASLSKEHEDFSPGVATIAVGGAAFATGLVLWIVRTSDGRQRRELQRIDEQLLRLGVQTRLSPWVAPEGPSLAGLAGGLTLSGKF